MKISSQAQVVGEVFPSYNQYDIKQEPMLFNCDYDHAHTYGSKITKRFLTSLPEGWSTDVVIDSRVHMLMPGWYPCIPGWHHDDVPRTRVDAQPNYLSGQDRSEHIILLLNGDICPTHFAVGESEHEIPAIGEKIYKQWNKEVDVLIKNKQLELVKAETNRMYMFDDRTWHTGTAAVDGGWRFFIRVSRYFDAAGNRIARRNPRTNEVRKQVQVYMNNLTEGW